MTPFSGIRLLSRLCIILSVSSYAMGESLKAGAAVPKTITAAATDWVKSASRGQCRGSYLEPVEVSRPGSEGIEIDSDEIDASADSLLHVDGHSTTLTGNISLSRGEQILKADFATIDANSETYNAEGNVVLRQPGLLITGEQINGSLFSGVAAIDSASFLLHQHRLRGSADKISQDSSETLTIANGEFTTCEPESNTWSINGKEIALKTAEGYGTAKDVTLTIKDVPVAWFPYFRFPIDDSRQSGFLVPGLGQDSDGGTDIALPYYFNLAPNYDATYTLRSIWKRGILHEGEFRYLNTYGENIVAGAYLPSDDEYDGRESIDTTNPGDFDKQNRWIAHFNHRGRKGPWSSTINYTSVSDIDYLQDLGSFTQTDANFNRALGKSSSPALLRTGTLTYDASIWRSVLELRSFQQLNQLQPNQYELLPRLSVFGNQKFGRIETSGLIQLSEFDRRDSSAATGSRSVIDGSARLPFRSTWGYITPGLRLIHRNYNLDQVTANQRSSASITSTGASIDAGLVFERRTTIRGQRLLQTLEPRFQYLYIDEDFQDDLPSFDSTPLTPSFEGMYRYNRFTGYDRIGDANRIAIGLTTEFSSLASGKRLLSASIGQIFHLRNREVSPGLAPGIDDTADTSPLFFQLTSQMKSLRVAASWELDTQSGRSNRGFLSARYRSPKNVIVNFNYAFTDEAVQRNSQRRNEEETDLSFQWPIGSKTGKWQIVGRWNYGWDDGQTIESLLGVEYNDCCWKARLVFRRNLDEPRLYSLTTPGIAPRFVTDRRADSGIYFEIQLKGLASLGGRLDSLLQDSIPGYLTDRQR